MTSVDETRKRCAWDISYMKKYFPQRDFKIMPKLGHDSLGLLNLELFKEMIGGL